MCPSGFSIAVFSSPGGLCLSFYVTHTSLLPTFFCQYGLCNTSLIYPFLFLLQPSYSTSIFPLSRIILPASTEVMHHSKFSTHSLWLDVSFKKMYDQINPLLKNIQQFIVVFINSFICYFHKY